MITSKTIKSRTCRVACTMIALALTTTLTVDGASPPILGPSTYEPFTFTTLAGLAQSSGSAHWTAVDVALDRAGNVYVADHGDHTIRKVTPNSVVTTLAGLAGSFGSADGTGSAARFLSPTGVTVDSVGNIYVSDFGNNTIRKMTPAGEVTTLAGLAGDNGYGSRDGTGDTARFGGPFGVSVDSTGNVYVADTGNNTIRKVTPAGVVATLAGLAGSSGSADGTGSAARFDNPRDVAVDSVGNVYVSDSGNSAIRKVTPAGLVTTLAGLAGSFGSADGKGSVARFADPEGIAVDSAGNVYIADSLNNTIRKMTPAGDVTTLAGLAGDGAGSTDGTGSVARFTFPYGVAVDGAGNVYVAGNNTIRKGHPAPRILTSGPGFGFNGGQFGFNLTGPAGKLVVVEASTDLVSWQPLWTNTFTFPATLNFSDPTAMNYSARFYRGITP
jgi:sugar lactone lactonase YvrE